MVAQCVAEVLGLDMTWLRVVAADSEVTPKDNGAYSSRVTMMVGNAAVEAATALKQILVQAAAQRMFRTCHQLSTACFCRRRS